MTWLSFNGGSSLWWTIFGRLFVKLFALCYQTVVCLSVCLTSLSVLSVTLVYCGPQRLDASR